MIFRSKKKSLTSTIENFEKISKEINEDSKKKIREQIIFDNLGLAYKFASKYYHLSPKKKNEIIQEACYGLIKAVDKFDLKFKTKFSTYAVFWIKKTINEYLISTLPLKYSNYAFRKLNQIKNSLNEKGFEEILKELNLKNSYTSYYERFSNNKNDFFDLGYFENDVKNIQFEDILNEISEDIFKELEQIINSETFNSREKNILYCRLISNKQNVAGKHTLKHLAQQHNITKERIRQIEKKAIEKVKILFIKKYPYISFFC